jgi:hypothetical protein
MIVWSKAVPRSLFDCTHIMSSAIAAGSLGGVPTLPGADAPSFMALSEFAL